MTQIGIRELKANASAIVHEVREERARYVITLRGEPVAVLMPIDPLLDESTPPGLSPDEVFEELDRLGNLLAASWPVGINSVDELSKMRR